MGAFVGRHATAVRRVLDGLAIGIATALIGTVGVVLLGLIEGLVVALGVVLLALVVVVAFERRWSTGHAAAPGPLGSAAARVQRSPGFSLRSASGARSTVVRHGDGTQDAAVTLTAAQAQGATLDVVVRPADPPSAPEVTAIVDGGEHIDVIPSPPQERFGSPGATGELEVYIDDEEAYPFHRGWDALFLAVKMSIRNTTMKEKRNSGISCRPQPPWSLYSDAAHRIDAGQ